MAGSCVELHDDARSEINIITTVFNIIMTTVAINDYIVTIVYRLPVNDK